DGENARDFDDAVLFEPAGQGFRLTVAVADVVHYVPAGSPLDLEARARGTSVYFPDRVLPMLPEELSNGICSLKPDEDRLVKAVRMELDARGRETAVSFHDAVMRSAARLTYTQVRQALADRAPDDRGVPARGQRGGGARARAPDARLPPPRARAADRGERGRAGPLPRGLRAASPDGGGARGAQGVRRRARAGEGTSRGAP